MSETDPVALAATAARRSEGALSLEERDAILTLIERIQAVEKALGICRSDQAAEDRMISAKEAATIWGVSDSCALRRAKRVGFKLLDGRWYLPRSVVEDNRC